MDELLKLAAERAIDYQRNLNDRSVAPTNILVRVRSCYFVDRLLGLQTKTITKSH